MIAELPITRKPPKKSIQGRYVRSMLPILYDLSTPLPEIPEDLETAFLTRIATKRLKGRQRANGGRCGLCNAVCPRGNIDHLIPRSRGGADTEGNLMLTCIRCNTAKSNRTLEEYLVDMALAYRALRRRLKRRLAAA